MLSAIFKKKTIVLSPRGELYDSALQQKKFKKTIWKSVVSRYQSRINFHATNALEASIIKTHFPKAKRIDIIPNYIEMPKLLENEPVKKQLIFLGRINPIKNIDLLIEAFSALVQHEEFNDYKLLIGGSARLDYELEYQNKLNQLVNALNVKEKVVFLGHISGDEKQKLLAASKALILPSKSENFGNVVLEALSQKTPVVASKNTPWAILEDYKAGKWVDATPKDLAKALKELLSENDKTYASMRDNALHLCKEEFAIESKIKIWENYYNTIVEHV
jgi:glycosyltransferase involved in cell wall biosynthesis